MYLFESRMSERTRWTVALLLALTTNIVLLCVLVLQTSGYLVLRDSLVSANSEKTSAARSSVSCGEDGAPAGSASPGIANTDPVFVKEGRAKFGDPREQKRPGSGKGVDENTSPPRQNVFQSQDEMFKLIHQDIFDIVFDNIFLDRLLESFMKRLISPVWQKHSLFKRMQNRPWKLVNSFLKSSSNSNTTRTKVSALKHGRGMPQIVRELLDKQWKTDLPQTYAQARKTMDQFVQNSKPFSPFGKEEVGTAKKLLHKLSGDLKFMDQFVPNSKPFSPSDKEDAEKANTRSEEMGVDLKRAGLSKKISRRRRRRRRDQAAVQVDVISRRSDIAPEEYYSTAVMLQEVFSELTDSEVEMQSEPVKTVVIPALIHFEGMVIRQLESLHATMVSHDHRLEDLEHAHLTRLSNMEPQGDSADNKTGDKNDQQIVDDDSLIPLNGSKDITVIDGEGSGEGEEYNSTADPISLTTITSTTTTTTTTTENQYELFRAIQGLEQKVLALENYNVMSDAELQRARREVIRMDDRVTELDRKQRNINIRTAMQTFRVTELEVFMSKAELSLHTTLDSFGRLAQRFESFRDRLSEYGQDIRAVQSQFGRQNQIMGELRSADSYKAHDINELRKSLLGLEERINSLYMVLDQNVDMVRNDVRTMIDGVCSSNHLNC